MELLHWHKVCELGGNKVHRPPICNDEDEIFKKVLPANIIEFVFVLNVCLEYDPPDITETEFIRIIIRIFINNIRKVISQTLCDLPST